MLKIIFGVLLVLSIASPINAGNIVTKKVYGHVVATDTNASPNTIVIKAKNPKGLDIIVGAFVEDDTVITIGKKQAGLKDILAGDKVNMVYDRNLRVKAKSIKVKR
ncbi:MAG: hypothetical protein HZC45_07415 [Deltaproteobacteria bacterium]|nr:hypothetical protein [Deltaproteobacteria bacterium]